MIFICFYLRFLLKPVKLISFIASSTEIIHVFQFPQEMSTFNVQGHNLK